MAKNLTNKNQSVENTECGLIRKKKSKKEKLKLITGASNDDSTKLIKKKRKRKDSNEDDIDNEKKLTEVTKINTEGDDNDDDDQIDNDNKNGVEKSKTPSKKQIKKAKAEQREMDKREQSKIEATQKALNYVSMWKHARSTWKFAKIRQIWLIDNLLDENAVPDSIFSTVLEYFEGCKGIARETLLKKGMDVIKKYEQKLEESDSIIETIELKRARQLLQALPTES